MIRDFKWKNGMTAARYRAVVHPVIRAGKSLLTVTIGAECTKKLM